MARYRHLPKAPIREALIDLKVSPHIQIQKVETMARSLESSYPRREAIQEKAFGFELKEGGITSSSIDQGIRGFRLTSVDSHHVLQIRVDGITISRLRPYDTWESLSGESRPIWESYVSRCGAEKVVRSAVRYINVMELPLPISDFRDFLTAPPEIPETLPQEISGFFSRLIVVNRDIDAVAIVTQALESIAGDKAPVVLDIDVIRERRDESTDATDPGIWSSLAKMRDFKNAIFFESITEKTASLFE